MIPKKKDLQILMIEDVSSDVAMIDHELRRGGLHFEVTRVDTRKAFIHALETSPPNLILSDHGLPSFDGFTALKIARDKHPEIPFIFVTNAKGEELAITSLRAGAADYVLKERLPELVPAVRQALRHAEEKARRQATERALKDSENRFHAFMASLAEDEARKAAVVDNSLDSIVSLDATGAITEWNPMAATMFGYSRGMALNRNLAELILLGAADWEALVGRRTEMTATRANGAEFAVELTLTRVDGPGSAGFTAYIRDIAEERKHEDELRLSEQRFRQLVEGVEEYAIYMLDSRGVIVTWNAGAERIEGYRAHEVLRRKFTLFFTPDEIAQGRPEEALAVARAEGRFQGERLRVRRDGSSYWSNTVVAALRDDQGVFYGFSVITRDLTKRKKAEAETHQLQAELEQRVKDRTAELQEAYHEMEAFSYSVSHDLRAPLIRIDGFVHMLEDHTALALDDKGRHYVKIISDAATQMGRMIDDLLTFSVTSRAEMHKVRLKLEKVLQDVLDDLQADVRDRVIEWKIGDFPRVWGDPALLRQAIFNLVSNAIKYTRGRPIAKIEIGSRIAEEEMVFFVRDNGAGFDMKFADKLFGVFQRLHSAAEFEGTGVGLANVRRIITRHGGRTWAEGTVDGGATFYFSLPDSKEAPDEAA